METNVKEKLGQKQFKVGARKAGSVHVSSYRPSIKTITVQGTTEGSRYKALASVDKPRRPTPPRIPSGSALGAASDVPSRARKAFHVDESSRAPRPGFDDQTGRHVAASVQSKSPHLEWYRKFEADRKMRVSETARVVSRLLADGLRQADKTMTLPQLSLAIAAISVEIVSGRSKPDLQDRIERILLEVSDDEFYESDLDEYNGDDDWE